MTRCDYDTIFQRVFCVTLVAIAFTFTVILTNVFVDIDGLLSRKDKVKTFTDLEPSFESGKYIKPSPNDLAPPPYYKQEVEFEESDDNYRSKRSLESQNFLFRIRNPKMKGILTSRLATLLEELDEEESNGNDKLKETRPNRNKEVEYFAKEPFPDENQNRNRKELKSNHDASNSEEDLLHLAMHNILLQGIIGHMDLNEVYRKVHMLINNFKTTNDRGDGMRKHHEVRKQSKPIKVINEMKEEFANQRDTENIENIEDKIRIAKTNNENREIDNTPIVNSKPTPEEKKFLEEMAGCDKLQSDVQKMADIKKTYDTEKSTGKTHLPNVLIKTIIDITSLNKNKTHKQDNFDSKERVKGIIKLIYNGKAVKFSKMDEDGTDTRRFNNHVAASNRDVHQKKDDDQPIANAEFNDAIEILQEKRQDKSEAFINEFLSEYLIKDPQKFNSFIESVDSRHNYKAKRYKRQIKIRYEDVDVDKKKVEPKKFSLAKTDDDELYVEIETHFDSKGMKGEKKKKLIRNLIDKIQKAIHSDPDLMKEHKKRKHRHYHVKKRTQHPLDKNRTLLMNKVLTPFENIAKRHSDPLSKTLAASQQNHISHTLADKTGETWRKAYTGPGFLTVAKSVNSAEMGEVNINYDKMQDIPPRQQIPLNTETSVETPYTNSFFNMGDLKFFIKDIDGTGLSIGFNQYTDEAPDPETMKVFTGIENIITNYNQNEDLTEKPDQKENNYLPASEENSGNSNHHVLIRRSIKEINANDYHSNEYRVIFNGNFLPYDNYEEVIEDKNKKIAFKLNKEEVFPFRGKSDETDFRKNIKLNELPALMGDNIFYKKLKPSEILNLASMINRKKRGAPKEVTKRKIKMNKFINRRSSRFSPKKLILSKKRSKRQIGKIRIIASDNLSNAGSGKESEENIFVVSNENIFADRAMVRNVEGLNDDMNDMDMRGKKMEENLPHIIPYIPYVYEEPEPSTVPPYSYRMNPLMSRYPHIIMGEKTSNENFDPLLVSNMQIESMKVAKQNDLFSELLEQSTDPTTPANILARNVVQTQNNVESSLPKQNYKLTVRILPRNASDLNSGFKEIHTSINKSFNRNGKIYSSLFNVSEISKIEPIIINTTSNPIRIPTTTVKPCIKKRILEQQAKMDLLLKQHRKKIDEQLEHLKAERNNLEALAFKSMLVKPREAPDDTRSPVTDFDINQLVAFIKMQSQTTTQPTTTTATTTTTTTTPAPDFEKIKVINTIKRNENLTNEILHQIKKNTELLQTFLIKLSDKMQKESNDKTKEEKEEVKPTSTLRRTDKIWKPYTNEQYNETQSPIPFVYAFQHPYMGKTKPDKIPLDSVVYHGLIHTLKNNKNPSNNEEIMNQTKYFIDDVENNFKDVANVKPNTLKAQNLTSVKI